MKLAIFTAVASVASAYWGNVERMYPIRTEKSYRLDDSEINFISEKPIRLDDEYFKTLRIGFNGYIGGTNNSKNYRILPIFMMNYDLATGDGTVQYTEKFSQHYKTQLIGEIADMFQVQLDQPKVLVVSWQSMSPKGAESCYSKETHNSFEAVLVWEKDVTFLLIQFQLIQAPLDCITQKYGLVSRPYSQCGEMITRF